jgi:hypothetical protein
MKPLDAATNKPRGWCLVYPQLSTLRGTSERQRPGELVASSSSLHARKKILREKNSKSGEETFLAEQQQQAFPSKQTSGICPVVEIKVEYCPTKTKDGEVAQQ